MNIEFTDHALERIEDRSLDVGFVKSAIKDPDKIDKSKKSNDRFLAKKVYFNESLDKDHLLLVVFEKKDDGILIITVIDTSKISKYL